jgi:hypothetical protein
MTSVPCSVRLANWKLSPVKFVKIAGDFVRDMIESTLDRAAVSVSHRIGAVAGRCAIARFTGSGKILGRLTVPEGGHARRCAIQRSARN